MEQGAALDLFGLRLRSARAPLVRLLRSVPSDMLLEPRLRFGRAELLQGLLPCAGCRAHHKGVPHLGTAVRPFRRRTLPTRGRQVRAHRLGPAVVCTAGFCTAVVGVAPSVVVPLAAGTARRAIRQQERRHIVGGEALRRRPAECRGDLGPRGHRQDRILPRVLPLLFRARRPAVFYSRALRQRPGLPPAAQTCRERRRHRRRRRAPRLGQLRLPPCRCRHRRPRRRGRRRRRRAPRALGARNPRRARGTWSEGRPNRRPRRRSAGPCRHGQGRKRRSLGDATRPRA
mmetsp:Transcript_35092/g.101431  ORF Transcript_35092/g.101431 Transcript_35092/m.101431 type:complete len:287 (+) Transcript_35092:285-1145(+)